MKATFESRLLGAVKRLSRRDDHTNQVQEVVNHFQDLVEENRATGMPDDAARKTAEAKFGNPVNIARDIVTTPHRIRQGQRLQWIGVALWLSSVLFVQLMPFELRQAIWRIFVPVQWLPTDPFFVSSILLIVVGAFRARNINRRAVAACFAGFTILCVGVLGFRWFNVTSREAEQKRAALQRVELQRKPQYEAFEQALKACVSESGNQNPENWKRLGEVLRQVNLPWVQTYPGQRGEWIALWNFPENRGAGYRFDFTTVRKLEDAKLMWKTARPLERRLSGIIQARQTNLDIFTIPKETMAATIARIVALQTVRFLFIFIVLMLLVRGYIYRADLFWRVRA